MRLASLILLALPVCASAGDDGARALLLRSLKRNLSVNVVAIIVQRDPKNETAMHTIRVERDRVGHTHHTIIQPLRLSGVETADDGDRARVFWPDQNLLIDQDSPLHLPDDAEWQMKVADHNYAFKFGGKDKIADRDTVIVIAQPKHGAMETRRFYLDVKTGYSLRLVTVRPDGGETLHYDTKDVLYPKAIKPERFDLKPPGTVRTLRYDRPEKMTVQDVEDRMGFEPMLPQQIPMGFRLQEMQLTEGEKWRAVAVRITDGLVRATVYQWKAGGADKVRVASIENSSFTEHKGVRLLLVSDLSPQLRDQLLAAFVERAQAEALVGQLDPNRNPSAPTRR